MGGRGRGTTEGDLRMLGMKLKIGAEGEREKKKKEEVFPSRRQEEKNPGEASPPTRRAGGF